MRYQVTGAGETHHVEVNEIDPHTYNAAIDDGEKVRVDAYRTPRTVYSILIGHRQYEGSVDAREDGTLDVHVGTSAFEFVAIDERRRLLVGAAEGFVSGIQEIRAQMAGKIVRVLVTEGQTVAPDDGLLIMEAMKMENEIRSPVAGVVTQVSVAEGDAVEVDTLLLVVDPAAPE